LVRGLKEFYERRRIVNRDLVRSVLVIAALVAVVAGFLTAGLWLVVTPAHCAVEYPFQVLLGVAAAFGALGLAEQVVREYLALRNLLKRVRGKKV
jgi:hypothetical protein